MMKPNRAIIQFGGLSVGTHRFEFEVTDKFFEAFEYSEIRKGTVQVIVDFVKQNNVMTLNIHIKGMVTVPCDRCMGDLSLPVENSDSIYIKHGDPEESNESMIVLPQGETEVDLAGQFYELIAVSVPMRRVPEECGITDHKCDEEVLKKMKDLSVEEEPGKNNPDSDVWAELKKIKFNNN